MRLWDRERLEPTSGEVRRNAHTTAHFHQDTRPIRTLSAGQHVRLWLAREFLGNHKPSLSVLDEATEYLDKETTDSILMSLDNFSAAILAMISHDDYFCEQFPVLTVECILVFISVEARV